MRWLGLNYFSAQTEYVEDRNRDRRIVVERVKRRIRFEIRFHRRSLLSISYAVWSLGRPLHCRNSLGPHSACLTRIHRQSNNKAARRQKLKQFFILKAAFKIILRTLFVNLFLVYSCMEYSACRSKMPKSGERFALTSLRTLGRLHCRSLWFTTLH